MLIAAIALTLAGAVTRPANAFASVSGQQEVWGEWGNENGKLWDPALMGADPVDGSVYVGNEVPGGAEIRIEKFSEQGTFEGTVSLPRTPNEGTAAKGFVGIAVDHETVSGDPSSGRFYVLQDAKGVDSRRSTKFVATKILAFSTQPNPVTHLLEQVGELEVPATGTENTLFEPREIQVDPSNHELVIMAVDSASPAHVLFQRIGIAGAHGTIGQHFIETGTDFSSPVNTYRGFAVGRNGVTYALAGGPAVKNGSNVELHAYTLPAGFVGATVPLAPLAGFEAAASGESWVGDGTVFTEGYVATNGLGWGPQVALAATASGEETLYWKTVVSAATTEAPGNYLIHGYSLGDNATGVAFGGGASEGSCRIQRQRAALAAGPGGSLIVLDQGQEVASEATLPTWFPGVFRFGPGGSLCPAPAASIKLEAGGGEVSSVSAGTAVTLNGSGSEAGTPAEESLTWKVEKAGEPTPVLEQTVPSTDPHPLTLEHTFNEPGEYTVRMKMKLASKYSEVGNTFAAQAKKLTVGAVAKRTLAVSATGNGEVKCKVNGGSEEACAAEYDQGTELTLVPKPGTHFAFSGWSAGSGSAGACAGTGSCTFTLEADSSVTAPFAAIMRTLTLATTGTGSGHVKCEVNGGPTVDDPCAAEYRDGTQLKLIAVAGSSSEFTAFESGTGPAAGCTTSPCTITLEGGNASLGARFDLIPGQIELQFHASGSGSGEIKCDGGACAATYTEGTIVHLSATPATHSQFTGWTVTGSGSVATPCVGTTSPCEVKMQAPGPVSATAGFAPVKRTLAVSATGNGEVKCKVNGGSEEACAAEYDQGTELTLVPKPGTHFAFSGWSAGSGSAGACAGTGNCTFTLEADSSVTAPFAAIMRTLTVKTNGTGSGGVSCNGGTCASSYPDGTSVTLAATAASGSSFAGWSGAGCSGTGGCTVTLGGDQTVTATFNANPPVETHPTETHPTETHPTPPPLKCRKGFKKKQVHGEARCVRVKKHRGKHRPRPMAAAGRGLAGKVTRVFIMFTSATIEW